MPEDPRGARPSGQPVDIRTGGRVHEAEKGAPTAAGTTIRKAPTWMEDNVMLDQ